MAGKGDTPRPLSVGLAEYATRWEATFGRRLAAKDAPQTGEEAARREVPDTPRQPGAPEAP